jgi:hypothetical protein
MLVVHHSQKNDATDSASPKTSAWLRGTMSRASGRRCVRFIFLSMSASATQFSALAPAAASSPPTRVFKISSGSTVPRSARSIAGMVVTSNSSITRGFVSARYPSSVLRVRLADPSSRRPSRMSTHQLLKTARSAPRLLQTMVDRGVPRNPAGSIR